jgi:DNA-binding transcriptional LysR family regulator
MNAGQEFHDRCADAVDDLFDAGQALLSRSDAPSGLVRVAAPADFFDFFPMEWLAAFLAEHPQVRVEFVLSDARADLIADRIDVAIRGGVLEDSGLFARRVLGAGLDGLVASPAYIAARGTPATLEDLAAHDCLVFAHPSGHATWRLSAHDGTDVDVQVAGRLSGNTVQVLRKAALAGLCIALLPSTLTRRELRAGLLVSVLPQCHRTRTRCAPGLRQPPAPALSRIGVHRAGGRQARGGVRRSRGNAGGGQNADGRSPRGGTGREQH